MERVCARFGTLVIAHAKSMCLFVLSLRDHRCKSCSSRETKSRRSSTPSRPRRSRTCGKGIWTPSSRPSRYALAIAFLLSAIAMRVSRWNTHASTFVCAVGPRAGDPRHRVAGPPDQEGRTRSQEGPAKEEAPAQEEQGRLRRRRFRRSACKESPGSTSSACGSGSQEAEG
jgi:hypothetical protein